MPDLRNTLLDLTILKKRLTTEKCANLIADCRKFPDDPVMQLMASFWMMSDVVLDEKPDQLHHQLFGRLGLYVDLYPEIADLLAQVRKDNTGLHLLKPTLQPAYRGLYRILRGHTKVVRGAIVLRDDRILTWSSDLTLRLWSSDGEPLSVMEGHTDTIREAIQLQTGRILSWSKNYHKNDTTLRLWSADGDLISILDEHTHRIWGVHELENGNILTGAKDEKHCLLWDKNGQILKKIELEREYRDHYVISLGKEILISHTLYTVDGEHIKTYDDLPYHVYRTIELQDKRLLSWDSDRLYFQSDLNRIIQVIEILGKDRYGIEKAIELRDGRSIVLSQSLRPTKFDIRLFTSDGHLIKQIEDTTRRIWDIKELNNGRFIFLFRDPIYAIEIWSSNLESLHKFNRYDEGVYDVLELDNHCILTFSNDETIRLWTSEGEALGVIGGQSGGVQSAGLSNSRPVSFASGEFSYDKTASIWNFKPDEIKLPPHHYGYPYSIIELRDGRILSCSWDASLIMWSKQGDLICQMRTNDSGSVYNAIELRNDKIISWSSSLIALWSKGGELLDTYKTSCHSMIELASGRIIGFGWDRKIYIWTANMVELYVLDEHQQPIGGVIELHDERILSWEGHYREQEPATLRLWSSDYHPLVVLEGHQGAINGAIELQGGRILSWAEDKTLRLWSATGEPLAVMAGHTKAIWDVFELADGRILSSDVVWEQDEMLLWSSDGQLIEKVEAERGLLISQGRDDIYWDRKDNTVKGYRQGHLIHEFVADTTVYAICGTKDGGVAIGDFRGNIHILKPASINATV